LLVGWRPWRASHPTNTSARHGQNSPIGSP